MKNLKKYLIFILGLVIFGFGIAFGNKSTLGGNPMSILVVGLSKHLPLSIGTCNLLVAIIEALIGFAFAKENVTLATIIAVFCGSYSIDLANLFIGDTNSVLIRIIYMVVGILLYCFGLALQQSAHCGLGNLDCYIYGMGKLLKIEKYHSIRWVTDGIFLIVGYLLGGIVGVGTIILLFGSGIIIEFFRKILGKILP